MDARSWLGLEPTHNPHRWVLPITPGVCTGGGFLFGGCGLGAAIEALEGTTGRPVVWATAQYVGHVADREVFTVNAALGERPLEVSGQWDTMPEVPPPDDSPPRAYRNPEADSLMRRIDTRIAIGRDFRDLDGTQGTGQSALWARMPDLLDMSAAALAILGDYVPFGVGQALGVMAGGNSLDNTLRVAKVVPTDWVLVDIRVHAVSNGFGHGLVHLWAEDGTLLATASQSCIVRFWKPEHIDMIRQELQLEDREGSR
jgi:acyl-CoA thioesterase-2